MATLLQMIKDICDELSLPRPDTIIDSTNQTARTLLAHANREGRDLVLAGDWTILTKVFTFTTSIGVEEYALPDDYSHLLHNTEWDRANARPLIGPLDAIDWQVLKSGTIGSGAVGYRFRIFRASSGNTRKIYMDPVPTVAGETQAFEYISDEWCAAAGGTAQSVWTADTDVNILSDRIMELGIQVRYRRGRGLNFASELQEYNDLMSTYLGQDRPSRAVNLASKSPYHLIDQTNIPDTGFGS